MIPKELDDLIKEYLTDGIISAQERKVLLRKAEQMGLDVEEVDLYITAQEQKVEKKETADQEKTFGKRCPACGRQVESMTVKCVCGYEFKDTKAASSVQAFFDKLNSIELSKQEVDSCYYRGRYDDERIEELKTEKKMTMISTFPVPNTKEDIIEFLAMAVPNSKKKGGKIWGTSGGRVMAGILTTIVSTVLIFIIVFNANKDGVYHREAGSIAGMCAFFAFFIVAMACGFVCQGGQDILKWNKQATAWRNKFDQVLMKGRSLRGDAEFQQQLDYYENVINQ